MEEKRRVKFIGDIVYWSKKKKGKCCYDPFSFTSETYCDFNDPSPLFTKILSAKWELKKYKTHSLNFRENTIILTCPYCGERFEVIENRVLRCPKCGNVIRKVNFEKWNENLEKFVMGEISYDELMASPVTIKYFNHVLDPPLTLLNKVSFRVAKYGFDKIFKFFTPYQLRTILNVISEIRKEKDEVRIPLSLALIDFISFNNIFAKLRDNKVYHIFAFGEPKVVWKWVELDKDYFYYFANKLKKRIECKEKDKMVSYPLTLDLELYEKIVNFYFPFLKLTLSDGDLLLITPRLFKEEFFECLDNECNSYAERKEYKVEKDLTKIISPGEIYVKNFKEIEKLIPYFHIKEVRKVNGHYLVSIGIREKVNKVLNELKCDEKVEGDDVDFLLRAFSACANNLTRYEIVGVKDLVKTVYSQTFRLIERITGTYVIPDKAAKVYIMGKKYGKSKEFFRILYRISGGIIVKFNEKSPLGKALYALKTGKDDDLDLLSKQILLHLKNEGK
ncbi:hypothetical protein [Sulfolobus sp. E11-6]|uniref:hypothetical protein n=1 Tax=Sulfolobus sp. E11-6 TaxID=2663020 RepID=UPI001294D3F2|nr:hypothetical protein [Sulfolobus sp. E11-6]QGA69065.1 hypothetical protein GFS33_10420 [Sulfolobus sp. E11-6]